MNLKLEIRLLFLGGFIRLIVFASDIYYLFSIPYQNTPALYVAFFSLFAPNAILLLICIYLLIIDIYKRRFSISKLLIALLFIIGDSIGLNYFIFTIILCSSDMSNGDFYIIDALFRACSLIDSLFQSMPQIVVQIYNNQIMGNWAIFNIFSIGISVVSLIYTIIKITYAIDKVQQYEKAASGISQVIPSATSSKEFELVSFRKVPSMNIIVQTDEVENDNEVYNSNSQVE